MSILRTILDGKERLWEQKIMPPYECWLDEATFIELVKELSEVVPPVNGTLWYLRKPYQMQLYGVDVRALEPGETVVHAITAHRRRERLDW